MHHDRHTDIKRHIRGWLLCGLLLFFHTVVHAEWTEKYTKAHPLIIASDMDFPPYEFTDVNGEPTGLNIDVLEAILTKMHIPHQFVMHTWDQAAATFEAREADLILDALSQYHDRAYAISRSSFCYYKIKIASRKDSPEFHSLSELKGAKGVLIRNNSKASRKVLGELAPGLPYATLSPKDALTSIAKGEYDYFLWGEEPLKWKIREQNLDSIIHLSDLDISIGEVHLVGHDKALIDLIDDQYARLQQNGEIDRIHDKWFHPERKHNDAPLMALYITLGIMLLIIGLLALNRLIRKRVRATLSNLTDVENIMRHALSMGSYSVMEYDVARDLFTNKHGNMLPAGGITMSQFIGHIHPDEQPSIVGEMEKLKSGEKGILEMNMRWHGSSPDQWLYIHGHSIAELDDGGKTQYIVCTVKDVTHEYEQERKDNELAAKYAKIIDSTLVAMSFYDRDGTLIALNQNMRILCCFDTLGEKFFRETRLFESEMFKDDLDPKSRESFHVCQRMYYPEMGINRYLECRVVPIYDNDDLQYYLVTARDVTAERDMYIKQKEQDTELRRTNDMINRYEHELNYLLKNSDMWVWRSDIAEKRIYFSRSLKEFEFSQSFDEYVAELEEPYYSDFLEKMNHMNGTDANVNIVMHYKRTPVNPHPQWCATSGIPVYDSNGKVTGHFGIVRDVTKLMEAQERLRKETIRAENSGKLKSAFLANMTHEIRTPLNAIVGFSDLLQMIDAPEERHEFIRIIRNNCDMLIRLINDIIEASNMDQGPLAIEAEDVDFAVAFNDVCQTLAQRVQEPGVEFIVDNPYASFVTHIDKGRLQQVITNFTTNAVKYTKQGHIKVGWRYEDGGIYMYCEDTGTGIPKEKQHDVFERFVKLNDFVQGTGLGLSICKSIADRCNGRIGVTSEGEGKGSTFWIWIPCEQKQPQPNK